MSSLGAGCDHHPKETSRYAHTHTGKVHAHGNQHRGQVHSAGTTGRKCTGTRPPHSGFSTGNAPKHLQKGFTRAGPRAAAKFELPRSTGDRGPHVGKRRMTVALAPRNRTFPVSFPPKRTVPNTHNPRIVATRTRRH